MNMQVPQTRLSPYDQWQTFIHSGQEELTEVRLEIISSWQRCTEMGVDPEGNELHEHLSSHKLQELLDSRKRLITAAHPFMAELYNIVKGTGFVVVLTNEQGFIMEMFGDEGAEKLPMTANFFIGASWHEKDAGTNAIGTALEVKMPVQVSGPEHFCRKHHCLTCSAAPLFDPSDTLIGTLDISGAFESAHVHTLGMVIAAAQAINAQLRIKKQNHQLAVANKKLVNFFNMVSDGVLILDKNGTVAELNPAAEKIFGQNRDDLQGTRLYKLLSGPSSCSELKTILDWQRSRTEIELTLETAGGQCQCLASAEPIINEQETVTGSFITLRPVKAVQSLIYRYSGYFASLQFKDIIGESQGMQEAIELAKLSAHSSSNVLLQGESGTGKEIFAQAIHNQGNRAGAPFIPLNCGAIPRELVGSELFGYEEGAFTGARKGGKPGKFELAAGGTLFLDEIGDMPLEQQAVLLRVIQEKRMTRIGGLKPIPVDVRLICATHKNLLEKVQEGTFRQDLYYRLNVMSITIPPLRERQKDIPLLFQHFLDKLCRDRHSKIEVDRALMHFLLTYPWPGNVRELQNVVERAANLAINGVVSVSQLPREITHQNSTREEAPPHLKPVNREQRRERREKRERQQIVHLLDVFEGNVTKVAKELQVSRKTVYNRMQRFKIQN